MCDFGRIYTCIMVFYFYLLNIFEMVTIELIIFKSVALCFEKAFLINRSLIIRYLIWFLWFLIIFSSTSECSFLSLQFQLGMEFNLFCLYSLRYTQLKISAWDYSAWLAYFLHRQINWNWWVQSHKWTQSLYNYIFPVYFLSEYFLVHERRLHGGVLIVLWLYPFDGRHGIRNIV